MSRKTLIAWVIAAIGALMGLYYSAVSTSDFIAHLDRQLHPISCSLLPGAGESMLDAASEGCKVALFSPYSSFLREKYWGGIPWSLPGMGLYLFALLLALWAIVTRRGHEIPPNLGIALASLIAAVTSLVFLSISLGKLHTLCTTCLGSYLGSAILLLGAGGVLFFSRTDRWITKPASHIGGALIFWSVAHLLEIGVFVALPVAVYSASLPDYRPIVTSCETLKVIEPPKGAVLPLHKPVSQGIEAFMVLDPLCPACKALHERLKASPYWDRLDLRVMPFPLDSECNWMLKDSMHPGACLLSRALQCAEEKVSDVLDFIFDHQEEMRLAGIGKDINRIRNLVVEKFPDLASCIDSNEARIKLNKTLHYAVDLSLPVITPQVYIKGRRLCDEDTDLGLAFALKTLVETEGATP